MLTEPQSIDAAGVARVAKLSDIMVRRAPHATARKDGDITAALAAMPAVPEILDSDSLDTDSLDTDSIVVTMRGAAKPRDVTPAAKPSPRDILEFWDRLRGTDSMPPRDRLLASEVAARWPNLVLFRCSGGAAMHPDTAFATALRANRGGGATALTQEPETTALLSQWLLRAARAVAADGTPLRDRSHIDTAGGRIEYVMIALPFAEDAGEKPGYVLCNVAPVSD